MSAPSAAAEREPVVVRRRAPRAVTAERPSAATRRFHESFPGYRPTPLRSAPQSARRLGVGAVIVKDESFRLGLPSFKILGASWAVCRAVADRLGLAPAEIPTFDALLSRAAGLRPLGLSAATDGNHGRAVAHMAAQLGFAASIYVPHGTATARIEAIESEGAEVLVVDGGYGEAIARSAEDAERNLVISDTSWPGYERVPLWISEGYATIFAEIEEQLAAGELPRPDIVVVPIGVGALAAAAVAHFWGALEPRPTLAGVEPVSAACALRSVSAGRIVTLTGRQDSIMAGLNCPTPSLTAWPLISQGIDVYLAIDDARVPEAMRLLGSDGVEAGETGAAGLAGLLRLADSPPPQAELPALSPQTTALVICTEGATDPESYSRLLAAPRAGRPCGAGAPGATRRAGSP